MKLSDLFEATDGWTGRKQDAVIIGKDGDTYTVMEFGRFKDSTYKIPAAKMFGVKAIGTGGRLKSVKSDWEFHDRRIVYNDPKMSLSVPGNDVQERIQKMKASLKEGTLTEGLWMKTNKYSDDPELVNGHEYLNIPGVPGSVKALENLDDMLRATKGKVTAEIIAYAKRAFTREANLVPKWLQWVADNKQRVAKTSPDFDEYVNY